MASGAALTRTIPAGEFKATCLKLMDEVNETGATIVITKRGRPVSRLVPVERERRGISGMFPELAGLVDDPAETVIDPEIGGADGSALMASIR